MLIGLTGGRGVGKSTIADIMVERMGFTKLHAFEPGKAMCVAYFMHIGIDPNTAQRLVFGDMKDVWHPLIPGDGTSRTFMEELGKFMGDPDGPLGPEFTLGAQLNKMRRANPNLKLVAESIVFESAMFRANGGHIIKIIRPQAEGVIKGKNTDAFAETIEPDAYFNNAVVEKTDLTEDEFAKMVQRQLELILDKL